MSRNLLAGLLVAALVGLLLANWLLHGHASFAVAELPGFYPLLTAGMAAAGVVLAGLLRRFAARREPDDA